MEWDNSYANNIVKIRHNEEMEHNNNALRIDYSNEVFAATTRSNILDGGIDIMLIDDMSDNSLAGSTIISNHDFSYKELIPYNKEESSTYTYYYWNYTTGQNDIDLTITNEKEYTSASTIIYNDFTLTRAIKFESSTSLEFTVKQDGNLTLVTASKKTEPTIKLTIDGETTTYDVSASGSTTIAVTAGTYTLTRGTTDTYLYLIETVVVSGLDYNKNVYYDEYNMQYIIGGNTSLVLDYSSLLSEVINGDLYPVTEEDSLQITPFISDIYYLLDIEGESTSVQSSFAVGDNLYTLVNEETVNIDYTEYNLDANNFKLTITNNNSTEVYLKNLSLGIEIGEYCVAIDEDTNDDIVSWELTAEETVDNLSN